MRFLQYTERKSFVCAVVEIFWFVSLLENKAYNYDIIEMPKKTLVIE